MLIALTTLLATLSSIFRSRAAIELENLALRHQIGVLQRSARKRPKLTSRDRLLWICLSRLWSDWRSALAIVQPETVIAWHRAGFRLWLPKMPYKWSIPVIKNIQFQQVAEIYSPNQACNIVTSAASGTLLAGMEFSVGTGPASRDRDFASPATSSDNRAPVRLPRTAILTSLCPRRK